MKLGMKVRKHDLEDILKFEPKILEFHFSDSDLKLTLDKKYDQNLIVHCFEYWDKKLVDLACINETNQIHSRKKSIELVQSAVEKTIELNQHFKGIPSLIVHPGGYTINEVTSNERKIMLQNIINAVSEIDSKGVNLLLENMPPYAWFFGGRWICNIFLNSDELKEYRLKTKNRICFDLCHSQLYCNKVRISIIDELKQVEEFTDHYHISDADGVEEEGLQFGEGSMDFKKIIPILNKYTDKSFAIEVWRGHENKGKGFKQFLDAVKKEGMIVS